MSMLYHECGNPLLMEGKNYGGWYVVMFYDGREEGNGKRIEFCPTCCIPLAELPAAKCEQPQWVS